MGIGCSGICKVIFAILLPPVAVLMERGCGADFIINICLTILGYIPGKLNTNTIQHTHLYVYI